MKGFLQEYGVIMVVVAVVLGMLAFGKTGYAKSIQDAILGSADHIVETGENIVPKPVKASDIIDIEGTQYIVIEKKENNQALVMTTSNIGERAFQSKNDYYGTKLRPDGQHINTYEGSEIDNYLENEWYNGLSSTMKAAIQAINIKQASYEDNIDPDSKQETGSNGQVYNTINRHAFLPSVSEIGKVIDLENKDKVIAFLKDSQIWTRDSYKRVKYVVKDTGEFVCGLQGYDVGGFDIPSARNNNRHVRPAFVIDLSGVKYTIAGHVDYK